MKKFDVSEFIEDYAKCPMCNGELIATHFDVNHYICPKCGSIEFTDEEIEKMVKAIKKDQRKEQKQKAQKEFEDFIKTHEIIED